MLQKLVKVVPHLVKVFGLAGVARLSSLYEDRFLVALEALFALEDIAPNLSRDFFIDESELVIDESF